MTRQEKTYIPGPKPINISTIIDAGDPSCEAFQKRLTNYLSSTHKDGALWATFDSLLAHFKDDLTALHWLVDREFFAVEELPDRSFKLRISESPNRFDIIAIHPDGSDVRAGSILSIKKDGSGMQRHGCLNNKYFDCENSRIKVLL